MTRPPRARSRPLALCLIALVSVAAASGMTVLATDHYDVSSPGAIATPAEDVTIEGNTYTVRSIKQVAPGESIPVDVGVPNDTRYNLELYNSDEQIEDFRRSTGSGSFTFDETDQYGPGSYIASLHIDGVHETIQPVVIAGYDVSVDHPGEVTDDVDTVTVNVTVTPTHSSGAPENEAEIAVWREGQILRIPASHVDGEQYQATVDGADLESGTYEIYAGALGSIAYDGEPEVMGVSGKSDLAVTEADSGGGSDPPPPPSGGNPDPGDDDDDPIDNSTDENGSDPVDNGTDDGDPDPPANGSDDGSDGNTILPANNTTDTEQDPESDDDGFPLLPVLVGGGLVALVALGGVYRYRS